MRVTYERCADLPEGAPPVTFDESPCGDVVIYIRDDLISEATCAMLTAAATALCAQRQLMPKMRNAS